MLPLTRGEEQRLRLGTTASKVEFITPTATASMPLTGTMGYSMCLAGETGTTCPFYLGSLTVTGTSPATIVDTCPDASVFTMVVSDLDIELLQPAMGIADAGSYLKGFPKGALHLQGDVTVDGKTYTVRGVNEEPFTFTLGYFGMFAADLDIGLTLPCGTDTIDMTVRIERLEHPHDHRSPAPARGARRPRGDHHRPQDRPVPLTRALGQHAGPGIPPAFLVPAPHRA